MATVVTVRSPAGKPAARRWVDRIVGDAAWRRGGGGGRSEPEQSTGGVICRARTNMKNETPPYFLVIDLEATCDEERRIPSRQMEIIEIGAVLCDAESLDPVGEFQTFVKPVRHPVLTPFCTRLTSITQHDVAGAPGFAHAIQSLDRFLDGRDALFCSWGDYDRNQFELDASFHKVSLPFHGRHLNLKKRFSAELGEEKRYGMASALRRVGLTLQGTHHRGIDDARNIARLLPWSLGRVRAEPAAGESG
jgi:3'-5' exoribonuclease 1